MQVVERFWQKVDKTQDCWRWTAHVGNTGYGQFMWADKKKVSAHRYSWELHNGPIPPGMFVCHTCDNRECVNPAHLFLGTHSDNMADMWEKGRGFVKRGRGEDSPHVKLTDEKVRQIRLLGEQGVRQIEIAKRFGVTQASISLILKRKQWNHV